jgi:2-dehydropantoate 2-reductase
MLLLVVQRQGTVAIVKPGAIGATIAAALHEAGRAPAIFGCTAREFLGLPSMAATS